MALIGVLLPAGRRAAPNVSTHIYFLYSVKLPIFLKLNFSILECSTPKASGVLCALVIMELSFGAFFQQDGRYQSQTKKPYPAVRPDRAF